MDIQRKDTVGEENVKWSERKKKLIWFGAALLTIWIPALRGGILCVAAALCVGGLLAGPLARMEHHGLPGWLSGVFLLLFAVAVSVTAVYLLLSGACSGLSAFMEWFPDGQTTFRRLTALTRRLPQGIGTLLHGILDYFSQKSDAFPDWLAAQGTRFSKKALKLLPRRVLFLFITVLAAYYAAVDWEEVRGFFLRILPVDWHTPLLRIISSLKSGFLRWLRVQGSLALMQLLLLTMGFLIIKVEHPLFYGALTAAADALPLLGTGSVLLPWTAMLWLMGDPKALWMLVLWLLSWALRTVMEPRLVGHQAGISPFFTVTGMYLGLRCFGITGMIAAAVMVSAYGNAKGIRK